MTIIDSALIVMLINKSYRMCTTGNCCNIDRVDNNMTHTQKNHNQW